MAEEGFLRRWSRMKATGGEAAEAPPRRSEPAPPRRSEPAPPRPSTAAPPASSSAAPAYQAPPPTLDDVARLTPASDFSAFVGQGVDKSVQRLALKKLFSDPHFRVMDGLDMYMDDYNKPSPMSAAMLAALEHAKSALRPSEPHRPQVAADTADAAAAAVQDEAGTDEALAAQAPQAHDEAGTLSGAEALPAGETACGGAVLPSVPEDADDVQAPTQAPTQVTTQAPIHATSACIQTGTHPQSLQGQA